MEKEKIIDLTNRLYNLTALFPKKEPLRYKIRETGDEILKDLIEWQVINDANPIKFLINNREKNKIIVSLEENFAVLDGYFSVSKRQNWVSFFDILEVENKYKEISDYIKGESKRLEYPFLEKTPETTENRRAKKEVISFPKDNLNERQKKIIDFLKKNEKTQVWQIKNIFPKISKRTLRRDFEHLLKNGFIVRIGERNNTSYQLK